MDKQIEGIYIQILVHKKKPLVWRSKSNPNCFKIRFEGLRAPIFLQPCTISQDLCIRLWDWELHPRRTLYT